MVIKTVKWYFVLIMSISSRRLLITYNCIVFVHFSSIICKIFCERIQIYSTVFISHLNNVTLPDVTKFIQSVNQMVLVLVFDNAKQPVFPVADHLLCSSLSLTIQATNLMKLIIFISCFYLIKKIKINYLIQSKLLLFFLNGFLKTGI